LWNKREGPIAEASAALRSARWAADVRRLEIQAALENAYRRYQVASQQLAVYEEGVLKQAEAALAGAEAAYKFGERGILEVLDAQRVLRGARLDFLNAQYDRQAALIELEQLRGEKR
jgi:cobalt-zinc-cadmium efflux system outer membrane protein